MTPLYNATGLAFTVMLLVWLTPSDANAQREEDKVPPTRVQVAVEIPAELPSFDDTALVAILYEFDPRIADKAADEVERVVIRHLGHQQGIEQSLRFAIGDKLGSLKPNRRYYISCRIYEDLGDKNFKQGKQVHYCHNDHPQAPGRVYDKTNGTKLTFVSR